jgi:thioredoxin-related protein
MIKKIFALIIILNLFILEVSANQKIMLDETDVIISPMPLPYDGIEYSNDDLNEFIVNAIKKDRKPIIIFGANWCPDCRIFSATMNIPKIKSYIDENFEVLYVDVKRYEINMNLMEEYGIEPAEGIPRLLVFDHNKKLINSSNTTEWRTARDRTSQEIFNFFQDMNTD